ncbi:MAG: glycosyltransferase family 2 protein [Methanosphaera sp.]|nr:glycosyltransferase family 2 protein [Methanobrevibacter sp.]MBQ6754238.1 glycosyltransferase family 2 protein [Bacteroidales bacterium]MBR0351317.1 glycosyltransferase family 2 protein [Clostridia bacterium]MBR0473203.1 glycosyltransferase family 2 protein [Methanosphaera sp.]
MKIGIDKDSIDCPKKNENEYIYIFDDEPLKDLLETNLHCIHYKHCEYVDINLTKYKINCMKQTTLENKDYDKLPEKKDFKIGIIIPNYNYENTLEKCFNSVFSQTYKNFEIVFVDDVSTDDSVKVAKKYLKPPHKIVELKQKRYNGGARNEAYLHLSDDVDYIFCLDSDDWFIDEYCLEDINNRLQTEPDVLFTGLAKYEKGKTTTEFVPEYNNKYDALKGWSGCGKVIKKELATQQKCLYKEGTLKEDRNQHCRICIYMNSFEVLKKPIYVWNRENNKSVTTKRNDIMWQTSTIRHLADVKQLYLEERGKDPMVDSYLEERLRMCNIEVQTGGNAQW